MTVSAPVVPAPLRAVDIDEHAQRLVGWHQDYSQLTPGRFEGAIFQVALGDVALVGEWDEARLDAWLNEPHDVVPDTYMMYKQADPAIRASIIKYLTAQR